MEEMELLEEKLKDYHTNIFDNRFLIIYEKDIQAIENLIKAYKELEEKHKKLFDCYNDRVCDIVELEENSIPKSVIREKIEELHLNIEKLQIQYEKEVHPAYREVNIGKQEMLIKQRQVLQEILEG